MFAHQDPAITNPFETNDSHSQIEDSPPNSKIGWNSTYLKSFPGFLKIFALVRKFMISSFENF